MSENTNKEEMSTQQFIALMIVLFLCLGVFAFYKNLDRIHYWYFKNFEALWSGVYLLVSGLVFGLSYWFLRKPLTEAKARMDQVSDYTSTEDITEIYTGKTLDGLPIYISEKSRLTHVQIIGSTGRGKTESVILPWTLRDLKKGASAIIIDGKGSPEIEERILSFSKSERDVHVKIFNLNDVENSVKINPLLHGSSEEVCDRLFEALDFEESEYYKNVQYAGCSLIIELLHENDKTVSFKSIHELLTDDDCLRDLALNVQGSFLENRVRDFLTTPKAKRKEQFSGVLAQIAPFATGSLSEILNADKSECSIIEMLSGDSEDYTPQALIFSLPTLKYQQQASRIGKLLLQELAWAISERETKGKKDFTPVFLDEFSSFVYPGFINILNKARSSGVAFHLSHQSLGDLQKVSHDFATSLNTNTNVKCIFGLNDPDTSDFFARHIGTKEGQKLTKRVRERGFIRSRHEDTGEASLRDTESYRIHPNVMKNLRIGQGVLHIPGTKGEVFSEPLNFTPYDFGEKRQWGDGFNFWEFLIGY